jgi:hypothetical protein
VASILLLHRRQIEQQCGLGGGNWVLEGGAGVNMGDAGSGLGTVPFFLLLLNPLSSLLCLRLFFSSLQVCG